MKMKIVQLYVFIGFMSFTACKNDNPTTTKPLNETLVNTISLDSLLVPGGIAEMDIQRFDSLSKSIEGQQVRAFTISAEELFAAMGIDSDKIMAEAKYKNIRAYLGYGKSFSPENPSGFKLYIVPVKDADIAKNKGGYDLSFYKNGKVDTTIRKGRSKFLRDGEDGGYMMDLNAPCPSTCPEGNN